MSTTFNSWVNVNVSQTTNAMPSNSNAGEMEAHVRSVEERFDAAMQQQRTQHVDDIRLLVEKCTCQKIELLRERDAIQAEKEELEEENEEREQLDQEKEEWEQEKEEWEQEMEEYEQDKEDLEKEKRQWKITKKDFKRQTEVWQAEKR